MVYGYEGVACGIGPFLEYDLAADRSAYFDGISSGVFLRTESLEYVQDVGVVSAKEGELAGRIEERVGYELTLSLRDVTVDPWRAETHHIMGMDELVDSLPLLGGECLAEGFFLRIGLFLVLEYKRIGWLNGLVERCRHLRLLAEDVCNLCVMVIEACERAIKIGRRVLQVKDIREKVIIRLKRLAELAQSLWGIALCRLALDLCPFCLGDVGVEVHAEQSVSIAYLAFVLNVDGLHRHE